MPTYFRGEITGVRTGEYDNKKYVVLQFLEKQDDGSVKFMEVNMPDGTDGEAYKSGRQIELPIRVSAKDKKIYYRATGPETQGPVRPAAKP